jgi:hypothetical protein
MTVKIKTHHIFVSREIIDNAERNDSAHCMGADAIRETIEGAWSVDVSAELIRFNIGEVRYMYPTPAKVSIEAEKFDLEGPEAVEPFKFTLDSRQGCSAPVIRSGPRNKPNKPRTGPNRKRKPGVRWSKRRYAGLKTTTEV